MGHSAPAALVVITVRTMGVRTLRRLLSPFILIASLTLFTACAAEPPTPEPTGPWAQEIRQAYEASQSEFAKEALSDGTISEAEYRESQQRWVDCMHDAGHNSAEVVNGNNYRFDTDGEDAADDTAARCTTESGLLDVEPIYSLLTQNPDGKTDTDLTAECLVREGVHEGPLTGDEYFELLSTEQIDANDPVVVECMLNPRG